LGTTLVVLTYRVVVEQPEEAAQPAFDHVHMRPLAKDDLFRARDGYSYQVTEVVPPPPDLAEDRTTLLVRRLSA
jgi:hypothetical protein